MPREVNEAAAKIEGLVRSGQPWSAAMIAQIIADTVAPAAGAPAYHVPGPYEIALQLGAALASSGLYQTPGAALQAAWGAVPEFFQGRDWYLREMVPMMMGLAAYQAEGGDDAQH